jgi:hypothetical protein
MKSKYRSLLLQLQKASVPKPRMPNEDRMIAAAEQVLKKHGYPAHHEAPSYERRVVGYIDVLGTKEATRRSGGGKQNFFRVSGRFGTIHGFLADLAVKRELGRTSIQASGFSDHVVLSAQATAAGVREILERAHDLYGRLLFMNRCLPRGAVVVGQLYHKNDVIFGPALLSAHELESAATMPRIVATQSVVALGGGLSGLRNGSQSTTRPHMAKDGALYYLDPLRNICSSCRTDDFRYALQEVAKNLLGDNSLRNRRKGEWLAQILLRSDELSAT